MQFESLRVRSFGRLHNFSLEGLASSLVVFLGPNEAGKSTLFEFFKTILYGIYPVNSEHHPYAPWSGENLEGEATLVFRGGDVATVSRRLRSAPEGKMKNGHSRSLRNHTVPQIRHISRELFEAVYALRLSDLTRLGDGPWEEVQGRLLTADEGTRLRPVQAVLKELREDSTALWRSSRRGKPQSRELEARIRELGEESRRALEKEAQCRDLAGERKNLTRELARLEDRQEEIEGRRIELETRVPIGRALESIRRLEEMVGDPTLLEGLPPDPEEELEDFAKKQMQLAEKKEELRSQISRLASKIEDYSERDRKLVRLSREIRYQTRQCLSLDDRETNLKSLEEEWQRSEKRLTSLETHLFGRLLEREERVSLEELSISDLHAKLERRDRLNDLLLQQGAQGEDEKGRGASISDWLATGLLLAGTAGVLGARFRTDWILFLAALFTLASGVYVWVRNRKAKRVREEAIQTSQEETRAALAELEGELRNSLGSLPLSEDHLLHPTEFLLGRLAELSTALGGWRQRRNELCSRASELSEERNVVLAWLRKEDFEVQGAPSEILGKLEGDLEKAERRSSDARTALEQRADRLSRLEEIQKEYARISSRRDELEARIRRLGDGDLKTGLAASRRKLRARSKIRSVKESLDLDYPDWKNYEKSEEVSPNWGQQLAAAKRQSSELQQEIQEKSRRLTRVETQLEHLQEERSLADIEGEIGYLKERLQETKEERDRLALLSVLVARGEESFREKHQPDVLRRAGHFLDRISGGRYNRIDTPDRSSSLEVYSTYESKSLPVDPSLSQGTQDQLYLSLRLALSEHLEGEEEPLPLFLDEIFVNWDRERREGGYQVLKDVVSRRQVFMLTCHPWFARELENGLEAQIVDLVDAL